MKRGPVLLALLALVACGEPERADPSDTGFVDVSEVAGLRFDHRNAADGGFRYPELMSAGAAWVDADGDGDLDAFLVQGGSLPGDPPSGDVDRLFLNRGDGTFEAAPADAVPTPRGYGTGAVTGDYDADGDDDLYVTRLGVNALLRNDGEGRFTDVTESAGVGDDGYSTAATFVDLDADGDLDLISVNYLDWTPAIERPCHAPNGLRDYCSPGVYDRPARDRVFRNDGGGRFTDVSASSGIGSRRGTGLGVVAAELTGDGRVDVFVANDQMANFLWVARGDGTYAEEALERGCALNAFGRPEASMGIAIGDPDTDGDWDLFVVHLDGETNTFYENRGGRFIDATDRRRLGGVSRARTGFGTGFADFDCDGDEDLFIANGSVRLGGSMRAGEYGEANQLLLDGGDGAYVDASHELPDGGGVDVSRAAAFADYDDDGDVDVLVANNGGPARLYRNDLCAGRHWLGVRLAGAQGLGATVTVEYGDRRARRLVQTGYGYGSGNDPRAHFGLGDHDGPVRAIVDWPDGATTRHAVGAIDRHVVLDRYREVGR